MSEHPSAAARRILAQARLFTLAFVFGVLLFAGVAIFLVTAGPGPLQFLPVDRVVEWTVAAIALGIGLGGRALGGMVSNVRPGADEPEIRQNVLAGALIAAALQESTGLIGGMVILNSGNLAVGGSLVAVSALLLITGGPDVHAIESAIRRAPLASGEWDGTDEGDAGDGPDEDAGR